MDIDRSIYDNSSFKAQMALLQKKERLLAIKYPVDSGFGFCKADRYAAVLKRVFRNKKPYRDEYLGCLHLLMKNYGGNHMTEKGVVRYLGYGRLIRGEWELSGAIMPKQSDHYCNLITAKEYDPLAEFRSDLDCETETTANKFSYIAECDLCKKRGSASRIYHRSDVHGWDWSSSDENYKQSKTDLCMGCWNKVRAVQKKQREADEIKRLTNKLNKVRLEQWRKSKQQQI